MPDADPHPRPRAWRRFLSLVRVDPTPLRRSRDFRLLFGAGTVFYLGAMVTNVALAFQLYRLADATTVRTAIVSGGILCVVGVAVTAGFLRSLWRYDARTDEHSVRQRAARAAEGG